jgi:MFS family permease
MNVLPVMLFGVFGGAFADVADRRKLVAFGALVRIGVVLTLGTLTLTGNVQVWHVYVGALAGSFSSAFEQPARQAMVFTLVPREHLMNAVTWHNVQRDASYLVGPAIAGGVIALLSIEAAYFVDGALFLPLILAMTRLNVGGATGARRGTAELLKEGFRFLADARIIMTSLSLDFALTFFGAYRPLLAIYARDILDVGAAGFGILNSAVALGGILGSAFVLGVGNSRRKGPLQLGATLLYAAAVAAFGFSVWFGVSLAICAVLGFCDTVAGTMRRTIIQLSTPEQLQGRVGALQLIVAQSGPALGGVQSGTMTGLIGAPVTLGIGAAICGTYTLVMTLRSRAMRQL